MTTKRAQEKQDLAYRERAGMEDINSLRCMCNVYVSKVWVLPYWGQLVPYHFKVYMTDFCLTKSHREL